MNDDQKKVSPQEAILSGAAAFAGLTIVDCGDLKKYERINQHLRRSRARVKGSGAQMERSGNARRRAGGRAHFGGRLDHDQCRNGRR